MTAQELELPKGWVKTTLDFLVTNERDSLLRGPFGSHLKKSHFIQSGYKVYEQKNAIKNDFTLGHYYVNENKFKELERFELKGGDIVMTCAGTIGRLAVSPQNVEKGIINSALLKIRLNKNLVLVKYFMHLMKSHIIQGEIHSEARGSAMNNLKSVKSLKEIPIPIPPLNEQKRIVSKIEELFSKIDSTKQSLEQTKLQLEHYKQSLFKSLFNKTKNFVSLEECSKIGTGGTPSRQKPEYYGGNISWVKTTEVQNSYILSTSEKITELGLKNSNAKIHPKNSVIVAMYGEGKTRGKCAILDIDASTNQACAVITCDNKKLLFKFCYYWFQSQYDQMRLKSSGGNQPNLNLGIIKKTQIPLPSLAEQEQIISQIEQGFSLIENTQNIVNSTLQTLQIMKMSVLKQAFEGKLVPQDPNDEPAEKLLERIKKEKSGNKRQ